MEQIEKGELKVPAPQKRRSEFGSIRSKKRDVDSIGEDQQAQCSSKKYKSMDTVGSDGDNDTTAQPMEPTSMLPAMHASPGPDPASNAAAAPEGTNPPPIQMV